MFVNQGHLSSVDFKVIQISINSIAVVCYLGSKLNEPNAYFLAAAVKFSFLVEHYKMITF